jgi:hypothetical protein
MFEFLENCCLHCWFQEELGEVLGSYFLSGLDLFAFY